MLQTTSVAKMTMKMTIILIDDKQLYWSDMSTLLTVILKLWCSENTELLKYFMINDERKKILWDMTM